MSPDQPGLSELPDLYDVVDGTWPAAQMHRAGPWIVREGKGGGQRVSAATTVQCVSADDLSQAEAAQTKLGQKRLFQLRDGQDDLDQLLEKSGYHIVDPVNMWVIPIDELATQTPPPVTAFDVWPPLAVQLEIWEAGGIGTERVEIMTRAQGPKTSVLGRINDTAAGSAFVAIHQGVAMLHALEIIVDQRRHGLGYWMMRKAALWARDNGASHFSVVCTQANVGANALYQGLGMTCVARYHYRKHREDY